MHLWQTLCVGVPAHTTCSVCPRPLAVWNDLFYTWTFSTRPQEIWMTCNQVVAIVWPAFDTFPGYGSPMHDLEEISGRGYFHSARGCSRGAPSCGTSVNEHEGDGL